MLSAPKFASGATQPGSYFSLPDGAGEIPIPKRAAYGHTHAILVFCFVGVAWGRSQAFVKSRVSCTIPGSMTQLCLELE